MRRLPPVFAAVVCAVALLVQGSPMGGQTQQPDSTQQQNPNGNARDLKPVHPPESTAPTPTGVVPQSYALVVGIAHYANLPASAQLRYPDRDAESIYTTLISQQGGEFPANHVHMLTNEQATQANI